MKMKLEIQTNELNVTYEELEGHIKDSLKMKNIPLTKVKEVKAYYVPNTKVLYYTAQYNGQNIKGEKYL